MAARSIWSGSISFGLVNIPVKLYTAVREHTIHFHMLHDQDKVRLQRKMVCPADGQEVHPEHIVKGYEVAPDQYVVVRQEELENLAPEASRRIEIRGFVNLADIDPVYYSRPYYLAPDENAAKAYRLLLEAMKKAKKVAIAKFVMRGKEYLAALRPLDDSLCLEMMHYGDEVSETEEVPGLPVKVEIDDRELKVAQQLIDSLQTKFKPDEYHDEYRERVQEMLDRKAKGEEVHVPPPVAEKPGRTVDLMAALEASLAAAKGEAKTAAAGESRGRGRSATGTSTRRSSKSKSNKPKGESRKGKHKGE